MEFNPTQTEAFWAKVRRGRANECWEWTAARINSGYGVGRAKEAGKWKIRLAHRIAWHLSGGEAPGRRLVCHRCDNKLCVNPAHLFLGTHAENTRDMMVKGRGNLPSLNDGQIAQVKELRAQGVTFRDIAKRMGVSTSPIVKAART